jgi:hypothetical protein
MKPFRPQFVLPIAALVLGAAVVLFLSVESPPLAEIRTPQPSTPHSRHSVPSTPLVERAPPERPASTARPSSISAPRKSTPKPGSDAVAQALLRRYGEIIHLAHEPKELLQKYIDEDSELSGVRAAKFEALKSPLLLIVLSQALDDPLLRPALLHTWQKNNAIIADMIDRAATKEGMRQPFTGGDRPSHMAAQLKALEPHLLSEYEKLRRKLDVGDHEAHLFEAARASDILHSYVTGYMQDCGYRYNPISQTFQLMDSPKRDAASSGKPQLLD